MKNSVFILLLTIVFYPLSFSSYAQESKIDSLKMVITKAKEDTNKVRTLIDLSQKYNSSSPDTSLMYAELALELSERLSDKKGMAYSLECIGSVNSDQGNYYKAIEYFQRSLKIREQISDKEGMADSYTYIGIIHVDQGNYDKAIEYFQRSLKIREQISDKGEMATCYNNIGLVYNYQSYYDKAIEYFQKSLKIKEENGDKKGAAASCLNIGNVHYFQGNYDKTIEYYYKSLKIFEENGAKKEMATCYNNIGFVHKVQGNIDKSIEYHHMALRIRTDIGDKNGMASSYIGIGLIYKVQGNYDKAIKYYQKSLRITETIGSKQGVANICNLISSLNLELKNYNKAKEFAKKGLTIAKEIGALSDEGRAYEYLSDACKGLNNLQKALEYKDKMIIINDSLFNTEKTKAITEMQTQYETEKKEQQIKLQEVELEISKEQTAKEKAEKEKQHAQRNMFILGFGLMIILSVIVLRSYRQKKKANTLLFQQKQVIEEKNKEITDSINYAKRIQSAILPPQKVVKEYLQESFILYKPKDIVAGDFYWMEHKDGKVLFAAADCTGHGVPGAMVSVVCNNALNRSVREHGLTDPGAILNKTREIVIDEFEKSEDEVKDGMDIALCSLQGNTLAYAGAHNPLWIIRNGSQEIEVTKANKQPIGKYDNPLPYTSHTVEVQSGDSIYIFSDGYVDQFGGAKGKKFMVKAFRALLLSIQDQPMEKQKIIIDNAFEKWRGDLDQIDDVCVIGVRVNL